MPVIWLWMIKKIGIRRLPTGSTCFMGFNVSLPMRRGVGSPSLSPTTPCMSSWRMTEMMRAASARTISMGIS